MYKVKLRGELCMGFGSVLSLAALILLIFVHVGTTNLSSTPRRIAFATLNVTDYGAALAIGFSPDPIDGLYARNATSPLASGQGIRDTYQWGLYAYCGLLSNSSTGLGTCSNVSAATRFAPYDALVADMASNYTVFTASLVGAGTPFRDGASLGSHTRSAYYLIIVGTVLCFVSLVMGLFKHTSTFLLSASLASLSAILVLAGAALWTAAISAAKSVNALALQTPNGTSVPLGIVVASGEGLTLLWAAFGCMTAGLVPYWISSCTFRG